MAMTSTNGDGPNREDVHALHRQGRSIRAIAEALGLARSTVHRWLTVVPEADEYGLDEDDTEAGPFDGYEPCPPFVFVGLAGGCEGQSAQGWLRASVRAVPACGGWAGGVGAQSRA